MNLTINNIGFEGKKEVLYALKNAANAAKQAEWHRASSFGPRPINKSGLVKERKEVLQAYMDMAVYDDAFDKVINELPMEKEGKELKEILKPQQLQWGEINPLQLFKDSLVVNCMVQKKKTSPDIINSFLNFLR